ncbi:MAG: hypothetical protein GVY27_06435 [Deinococcus-Thermus bacterium]|jgi:hypothetical protein|nr:hypothetical protein [Deinococcota bacterium]
MARSYQTLAGLPSPLLFAGALGVALATFLGGDGGRVVFPEGGPDAESLGAVSAALAPAPPLQEPVDAAAAVDLGDGHAAHPSHRFAVEGLVLSRRPYRFGTEAAISPLDLVLGWGPMSNPAVVSDLTVTQSGRFGHVRASAGSPVDLRAAGRFWSNMHLIPASEEIAARFGALAEGRVVRLTGHLVEVRGPGGWRWRSSTSRLDRGAGACELVLVERVEILR